MEANNNKAMRDALEDLKREAETTWEYMDYPIAGLPGERGTCPVVDADRVIDVCKAALSKPPRNCDALSKAEVLEALKDRSFSKEDTIEWLYDEAKGATK